MKKVCFLLPKGVLKPTSLFSAIEVFQMANEFAKINDLRPFYEISVVAPAYHRGYQIAYFL
jgi:hypothetical protein